MADPPGTCHLVGCPTKGTADVHTRPIGAPDSFEAYSRPVKGAHVPLARVRITEDVAARLLDWLAALPPGVRRDVPAADIHALSQALAFARNERASGG